MSDEQIISKLKETAALYGGTGDEVAWTLYDLQSSIEEIFEAVVASNVVSKNCKGCKWWERHGANEGFCLTDPNMQHMYDRAARQSIPGVWAKHDQVRTRPDFGCIEWEPK